MSTDELIRSKKEAFLEAFGLVGTITAGTQSAGVARSMHYYWLDTDKEYAARFAEKELEAGERMVQEARRRAMVGIEEPIVYQGKIAKDGNDRILTVNKKSDILLMFLIKGALPQYRDRMEHTGKDGGPIDQRVAVVVIDGDKQSYIEGIRQAKRMLYGDTDQSSDGHDSPPENS